MQEKSLAIKLFSHARLTLLASAFGIRRLELGFGSTFEMMLMMMIDERAGEKI